MADTPAPATTLRLTPLVLGALLGFAGNSLLCREALRAGRIDPATFTAVRMGSGALVLLLLARRGTPTGRHPGLGGSWPSAAALGVYALCFSLAYVTLAAGTGALLLFGSVQLTMLVGAARRGDTLAPVARVAALGAAAGLLWLLAPTLAIPSSAAAAALMIAAGIGWGLYSLRGAEGQPPLVATAGNFVRTAPALLGAALLLGDATRSTPAGVLLALLSGVVTSGMAYALWFAALRVLRPTTAALLQLSVPVLASVGGALWLREPPALRTILAGGLVLGSIAVAIRVRAPTPHARTTAAPREA